MKTKSVTNLSEAIALMLAAAAALVGSCVMAAPMHWVYEAVDPAKCSAEHAAALDAQDHAHVVYGRDALYYDWEDTNGWHTEVADASVAPEGIAMVLDGSGRPHVAYIDMLTYTLKYARRDPGGWVIETIAHEALPDNGQGFVAIDLDSASWPHVGYRTGTYQNMLLKHISKGASGWHESTVGSWSQAHMQKLIIKVADDGRPHLACVRWALPPLISHVWREESGWQSSEFQCTGSPILQFDAAGRLHWVQSSSDYVQTYCVATRQSVVTEQVCQRYYLVRQLALSRTGVPHVLLGSESSLSYNRGLHYWFKTGGIWTQTVIDTNYMSSAFMTLDGTDRPYLIFNGWTLWSGGSPEGFFCKSAWRDAQGWHTQSEISGPIIGRVDLGVLSKSVKNMSATAINDVGEIAGNADYRDRRTAFLLKEGKMYDLAALLVNGTGWTDLRISDLNNQGCLVGQGLLNGVTQAFVAVPVTQP